MASTMFQHPVRPRKEDADLEVLSTASAEEERSTSDAEDQDESPDLVDQSHSEAEADSHAESVESFLPISR